MADDVSSYVESGRRDLNATASMRGRCFYWHSRTPKDLIGSYRQIWTGKHYGKHLQAGVNAPAGSTGRLTLSGCRRLLDRVQHPMARDRVVERGTEMRSLAIVACEMRVRLGD